MKTAYLLVILVLLSSFQVVKGQKMPSDYFEEGERYYQQKDYERSFQSFSFIVTHHPKNELYPRAYFNLGELYFKRQRFDSAIIIFKTILNTGFDEQENLGGDIMADPYTNYKHRSSEVLSDLYYKKKDFDSALYYFTLSDKTYPYLHICGNEHAANDVHTALKYADIYDKLHKPDQAISSLLSVIFVTLANNQQVITNLARRLKKHKKVKHDFDIAVDSMYPKQVDDYYIYYISFLGAEIAVPGGYVRGDRKFDRSSTVEEIKKSSFYKMLKTLN